MLKPCSAMVCVAVACGCGRSTLALGESPAVEPAAALPGEAPRAGDGAAPGQGRGRGDARPAQANGPQAPRRMEAGPEPPPPPFRTSGDCIPGFIQSSVESLSFDGRHFAYVDPDGVAIVLDRDTGERLPVTAPTDMGLDAVAISGDGARAAFKAYAGNAGRMFLWEREADLVLAGYPLGDGTRGALSADGRFVAFSSRSEEIALPPPHFQGGVFVADVETGGAWQASVAPSGEAGSDYSAMPDLTDDGRFTVFASVAPNLVAGKPDRRWDVYLHDRREGRTTLAAPSVSGGYPDDHVQRVRISGDGTTLAFDSSASDLVAGDGSDTADLFVREREGGDVRSPTLGRTTASALELANLSRNGELVLFATDGDGLVDDDHNGRMDVFLYDAAREAFELVSRAPDGALLGEESTAVALSGDGRVAAFGTRAEELTGGEVHVTCFAVR